MVITEQTGQRRKKEVKEAARQLKMPKAEKKKRI
jgi:hypothetical protein